MVRPEKKMLETLEYKGEALYVVEDYEEVYIVTRDKDKQVKKFAIRKDESSLHKLEK